MTLSPLSAQDADVAIEVGIWTALRTYFQWWELAGGIDLEGRMDLSVVAAMGGGEEREGKGVLGRWGTLFSAFVSFL